MNRYKSQFFEHASDHDIVSYFVDLFGMYIDDPEFIGRMVYTLLMNSMIKVEHQDKKFNKKVMQKAILKYLYDRW